MFFIYFYLYYIYDDAIRFPTDSDAFSFLNIGYTMLLGKGNSVSRPFLDSSGLAPTKVILSRSGFGRTKVALTRWTKRGLTTLVVPGHDPPLDITIYMDVESEPGPGDGIREKADQLDEPNRQMNNTRKITYSRVCLLNIRRQYRCSVNPSVLQSFKLLGILRYRGSRRGCRRRIPVRISNRRDISSRNVDCRPVNDMARAYLVPIARQVEPMTNKPSSEFAVPKFLFTNICSLAKTKNRVRAAVALEADLNNKDIDICVVSETHLTPEMPDAIVNIPGYNIFRRDRNWSGLDSRRKGGIAIFSRSNLDVIGCCRSKLYELLCLTFKLPSGHLLLVCGVYHPPQPTYRSSDFLQYLVHLVDNALDQHPGLTIVMGGDTNHLDVNELCQLTGWNSLVDFPTRGVAYLDNVLTNRPDLFGKCAPFSISIKTDHTAVILPAGSKLKPVRQKVRIRDCRKHRKGALYLELAGETWDSVLETNDVEEAVNNLETLIHSHMDRCMPFRTVSISSRDPAWMTPLLKSLLRSKSRFGQYSGDRLREINRRISEVISENRRNLLQAHVGSREWWAHVDSLSQRRCSSAKVTLGMQSLIELNDYFAELCWDTAYKQPTPALVESRVQVPEISERQVWNCLQHLKKTATGPDLIPFWVWKDHAEIFTPLICKI